MSAWRICFAIIVSATISAPVGFVSFISPPENTDIVTSKSTNYISMNPTDRLVSKFILVQNSTRFG